MKIILFSLLLLCFILKTVTSARILCLFPVPSKSHLIVFTALTKELASRGHELVVVSPFPLENPPKNYKDVDTMDTIQPFYDELRKINFYDMAELPNVVLPFLYMYHGKQIINATFSVKKFQDLIQNDKRGFDLVICEDFLTESLFAFADYYKTPLVLITSMGGFHWTNYAMGSPNHPAYIPNAMLSYTDHMTITERLINLLFTIYWNIGQVFYHLPSQENIRHQIFGDKTRTTWELRYAADLVLINSHYSLNQPRPLAASMIEVGGMHVKQNHISKLPKDLSEFMENSNNCVIYFSMGTNLRSDEMPNDKRDALFEAFSQLSCNVIMKWDSTNVLNLPKNIKIGKWLPQQDILAHRNTKVFITHGGLLSAQEAIYYGIPLIGIPIFGDQTLNMKKAEAAGYGILLEFKNLTKPSLLWAINTIFHDPRIREEAQARMRFFKDQPQKPLERAVYWVEYVLRHKGAKHLRSSAADLMWYQYYMLDLLFILITPLILIYYTIKYLCCRKKTKTNINNVKNKKKKQ